VHVHAVVAHVEGDVGGVQEVVGEEVLDRIALVAKADHEVMNPVGGVLFHDVPKNWLAADLDHRLGLEVRLFADARAQATRQNYCLHRLPSCSSQSSAKLFQAFAGCLAKTLCRVRRWRTGRKRSFYGDMRGDLQETRQLMNPD
jgi:hypothetical protein